MSTEERPHWQPRPLSEEDQREALKMLRDSLLSARWTITGHWSTPDHIEKCLHCRRALGIAAGEN